MNTCEPLLSESDDAENDHREDTKFDELESMKKHNVWTLNVISMKIINTRWILRIKGK